MMLLPQRLLQETGSFSSVNTFDASIALPSLSFLQHYDVLLVWSSGSAAYPFKATSSSIGDVLAQYWDGGGSVVLAVDANYDTKIAGSFGAVSSGYTLMDESASGAMASPDALGALVEPQSPLLVGVSNLSARSTWHSAGAVINGGIVVASWMSGAPLVVRGTKAGRPLVALNMYPVSAAMASIGWTGDGAALMRNALLYSACSPCGDKYSKVGACSLGLHTIIAVSILVALMRLVYTPCGDIALNFRRAEECGGSDLLFSSALR